MRETAELAGLFAAHGIWSIADGAVLVPLLGYEQADGERGLDRFAAEAMPPRRASRRCMRIAMRQCAPCW